MSKPIALQLYSLREEVYPEGDGLPGVLKTVAGIGYKGVEMAGFAVKDAKEIARTVSDLGLTVCGGHVAVPTAETAKQTADDYSTLGAKAVACGGFGPDDIKTLDQAKTAAARLQTAAELLKPHGISFSFHNHWWEFNTFDGRYIYDILLAEAPDLQSELDVYWCAYAKSSPVMALKAYGERISLLHVKDGMLIEGNHSHTAVGSGRLDIQSIIDAADPNTLEWLIVELDACETDMLEAVKQSYAYLTSTGLAEGSK